MPPQQQGVSADVPFLASTFAIVPIELSLVIEGLPSGRFCLLNVIPRILADKAHAEESRRRNNIHLVNTFVCRVQVASIDKV